MNRQDTFAFVFGFMALVVFLVLYWCAWGYILADFNWPADSMKWTVEGSDIGRFFLLALVCLGGVISFCGGATLASEINK